MTNEEMVQAIDEIRSNIQLLADRQNAQYTEIMNFLKEIKLSQEEERENDPLYGKALEIVLRDQKASATYLQRKLQIGYSRAAHLLEMMEENDIIGPPNGASPREIYPENVNKNDGQTG